VATGESAPLIAHPVVEHDGTFAFSGENAPSATVSKAAVGPNMVTLECYDTDKLVTFTQ
jgi:hypothetical protein